MVFKKYRNEVSCQINRLGAIWRSVTRGRFFGPKNLRNRDFYRLFFRKNDFWTIPSERPLNSLQKSVE